MAFSATRFKTSKMLIVVVLLLAMIAIPVIGPFIFYNELVPYLAPVLPKPDGAPSDAQSEYHWKGFGLSWHWERELPSGCATWRAAEGRFIGVRLKLNDCGSDEPGFGFSNFINDDDVNFNPIGSRSHHCSIHTSDLTPVAEAQAAQLLSEAEQTAKSEAESRLIELSQAFLSQPEPAEGEHPCGEEYAEILRTAGKWP